MPDEGAPKPDRPTGPRIVASFCIDDGSLDSITPKKAFVLGVEWQMTRDWIKALPTDLPEERPKDMVGWFRNIHTENANRLVKLAAQLGRSARIQPAIPGVQTSTMERGTILVLRDWRSLVILPGLFTPQDFDH